MNLFLRMKFFLSNEETVFLFLIIINLILAVLSFQEQKAIKFIEQIIFFITFK